MPREDVFDADGNVVENIPTEEEIKTQQEEAIKTSQTGFEKSMRDKYEIPEDQKLDDYLSELKESSDPNYKEVRKTIKSQKNVIEQLKKDGKTIDEEGNIVEIKGGLSKEEIEKTSEEAAKGVIFRSKREEFIGQIEKEEDQKVVNAYLDKLLTGEEKSIANLTKFFKEAVNLTFPEQSINPLKQSLNVGGKPMKGGGGGDKTLTPEQKELGKMLNITDEDIKAHEERNK